MRVITLFSSLLAFAAFVWAAPASGSSRPNQHLLVHLKLGGEGLETVAVAVVEAPLPPARSARPDHTWRVTVREAEGAILHRASLADPSIVRGPGGPLGEDHVRLRLPLPLHFAVRVPLVAAAVLEIDALNLPTEPLDRPLLDRFRVLGSVELAAPARE